MIQTFKRWWVGLFEAQIQSLITRRLIDFHSRMIADGQIPRPDHDLVVKNTAIRNGLPPMELVGEK